MEGRESAAVITTSHLYAWIAACFLPLLLHVCVHQPIVGLLLSLNMTRPNFKGNHIPTAGGITLIVTISLTLGVIARLTPPDQLIVHQSAGSLFLTGSLVISFWGLIDDLAREEKIKGFRGHLGALWRDWRITSGLVKMFGAGVTSFLISLAVSHNWLEIILNTGLIALCCNLINLFDLRPGRALKIFWLSIWLVVICLMPSAFTWLCMLAVLSATAIFFPHDASGQVMLGDTGANYLGFILGYSMLGFSLTGKLIIICLLLLIHLLAERISFSELIQSVPVLKRLDRWGIS